MSDQTTLMRTLMLMALLSRRYGSTVEYLAEYLVVSPRTVRRYLSTVREAGYVVECRNGRYHIDHVKTKRNTGFDIGDLLYFSKEEAQILSAAIETVEGATTVKEELARKLYSLYDDEKVAYTVTRKEDTETVRILIDAIRNKKQITVLEYTYSTANRGVREMVAEPLGFAFGYSRIWAYVPRFKKNMVLRLSGMAGVKATDITFRHEQDHRIGFMDPFRSYGFEKKKIRLELDIRAYGLMVDEFPLTRDHISRITADEFLLETEVCNFGEIGRFIAGLPSYITILEPQELRDYVEDRHRQGLDPRYRPKTEDAKYLSEGVWENV